MRGNAERTRGQGASDPPGLKGGGRSSKATRREIETRARRTCVFSTSLLGGTGVFGMVLQFTGRPVNSDIFTAS